MSQSNSGRELRDDTYPMWNVRCREQVQLPQLLTNHSSEGDRRDDSKTKCRFLCHHELDTFRFREYELRKALFTRLAVRVTSRMFYRTHRVVQPDKRRLETLAVVLEQTRLISEIAKVVGIRMTQLQGKVLKFGVTSHMKDASSPITDTAPKEQPLSLRLRHPTRPFPTTRSCRSIL